MKNYLTVKNLNLSFDNEILFDNFSFEVKKGQKVAIIGESGTGKTTLLNIIMGFETNYKGELIILDKILSKNTIRQIRSEISWLPQQTNVFYQTTEEMFNAPFEYKTNKKNKPKKKDIHKILNRLGLEIHILNKHIHEISGGQKQRIALASCILLNKKILFLDEPTSALDETSIDKLINNLLKNNKFTIISSSHNENWIKNCDLIIDLNKKEVRNTNN